MKNTPIMVKAVSVAALMGAQANAVPVGNAMDYTQDIVITGNTPTFDGAGVGTGSGAFDSSGELTVESVVQTSLPALGLPGIVTASTVYQGTVSGDTWTYSGTSQSTFISCTGNPTLCLNVSLGPAAPSTGNAVFTLDILSGGTWMTSSTIASLATLDVTHGLTPVPAAGPRAPGDPNAIPTMSAYGLGITAIALFGAAARRLRTSKKRK